MHNEHVYKFYRWKAYISSKLDRGLAETFFKKLAAVLEAEMQEVWNTAR